MDNQGIFLQKEIVMKGKIIWAVCALMVVVTGVVNALEFTNSHGDFVADNASGWGFTFTPSIGVIDPPETVIPQTVYLLDWTFRTSSKGTGFTPGDAYLCIFSELDPDLMDATNFIGSSTNTINFVEEGANAMVTWQFDGPALDKDTEYALMFSRTSDETGIKFEQAVEIDAGDPYSGGGWIRVDNKANDWDPDYLATYSTVGGVSFHETGGSTDVVEGGRGDSYTITFDPNDHPTAVTMTIDPDDELDIGAGQGVAVVEVFPAGGHESNYVVNVNAWNDNDNEGPHIGVITHTVTADDPNYDGMMVDVTVNITDDDGSPGIVVSKTSASCAEDPNYTDSYTVSVETPPSSDVTVTVNTGLDLKAVASLVFNSSNWQDAQTVAVEAQQDALVEGTEYYTITHSVSQPGGLQEYDGMTAVGDVAVVIGDNDANGPTATTPYAWYKAESGAVAAGSLPAGDGERVIEWQDQSGNLRHLDVPSGPGALYEASSAKGGQPALRTDDGTVAVAEADFGALAHPKTVIVAATEEDGYSNYYFDSSTSSNRNALLIPGSSDTLLVYAGTELTVQDPPLIGSPAVLTAQFGDLNTSVYFNGLLQASGDAGTQELRGLIVGARYNNTSRLTGTITEVLVYDGVLSSAERAEVEDYLMAKWLEAYEVYETGAGGTVVTEEADPNPNTDNFYVAAIGTHASGTVTSDPDADVDLGSGGDTAINLNFAGGSATEMLEVVVTAVDDALSEGPETSVVVNTGSDSEVRDVEVLVNDNERYCGDNVDGPQTYAPSDFNRDCYVDLQDFALFARDWLRCTDPFYPVDCPPYTP